MTCMFPYLAYLTADVSLLPPTHGFGVKMFSNVTMPGISAPSGPRGWESAPPGAQTRSLDAERNWGLGGLWLCGNPSPNDDEGIIAFPFN